MRVNRSTLAKLCLLTALTVPVQRSAFAAITQGAPEVDSTQLLIAQDSVETEPMPAATSLDNNLTATVDEDGLVIVENAEGETVAGPLTETGGEVTALAFSDDGETLATGTQTGQVRFWSVDGEPKGDIFQPVVGDDNAITTLRFEDDETLFVGASQGRQGLWGLDGLPPGEAVVEGAEGDAIASADTGEGVTNGPPWWVWLIPLLGISALAWLLLSRRQSETTTTEARRQTSPTATVPPPATDPETGREVSSRAQTVISTDRVVDESRVVGSDTGTESAAAIASVSSVSGSTDLGSTDLGSTDSGSTVVENSPIQESTDLESPDLEGTNLDISTASLTLDDGGVDGSATGLGDETADNSGSLRDDVDLEDDDPWDDNLELTLDDESDDEPPVESAESILARSLKQEPTERPAVEMPAIAMEMPELEVSGIEAPSAEAPSIETLPVESSIEAPSVVETSPVLETPADEALAVESPLVEAPPLETLALETLPLETPAFEAPPSGTQLSRDIDNIEPTRDTVIAETETILDIEPTRETIIGDSTVIFSGAAVAGVGAALTTSSEAASAESPVSVSNRETSSLTIEELASVDGVLADLPDGYRESRIVLLPRDPEWAYAYWDVSNEHKEELRQQGGQRLMLRLYDVTDLDLTSQSPHSMRQIDCHEMARSWYLEIPTSDRDYITEIGYLADDERWLLLARSASIRVPPIYPADWVKDQFVTIDWKERLAGRTFGDLGRAYGPEVTPIEDSEGIDLPKIYDDLSALTQSQDGLRVSGSLYGSMQQALPGALSPSGGAFGLAGPAGPKALNTSGINMSGLTMSGIGSGASGLPERSRKFWLVADAELIVYGATEPDATLTIGDKIVSLNPDGTFRFHVSFPDGEIDYPIRAVAADEEQTRSTHLHFERDTPERDTNSKDEAEDEWF